MKHVSEKLDISSLELKDQVVSINRVTKVVKGGKNLSFSALVVIGDGAGHVGYGMGKAREAVLSQLLRFFKSLIWLSQAATESGWSTRQV